MRITSWNCDHVQRALDVEVSPAPHGQALDLESPAAGTRRRNSTAGPGSRMPRRARPRACPLLLAVRRRQIAPPGAA